jgi:magnesium chelatase subunit D
MSNALADALLAARLLGHAPGALRGICLRGGGPAAERVLAALAAALPPGTPWRRLPGHIDEQRLCGGTDMAASLAAGRQVRQRGLLEEAAGGVLVVPMAQRLRADLAGRVAQALDGVGDAPGAFLLVLLDDGAADDERPPAALMERIAFDLPLGDVRLAELAQDVPLRHDPVARAELDDDGRRALAGAALALGVASMRAPVMAAALACAHAALAGRERVLDEDLALAARLVLAPRATQMPTQSAPADAGEAPDVDSGDGQDARDGDERGAGDAAQSMAVDAARAAIPRDVLDRIAAGQSAARRGLGGGAGRRVRSARRGRPLAARPGVPGGGVRLALVDTLRAAIPWQRLRQREAGSAGLLQFRREDLRVRRFEERATTVTVFCVDASGSTAVSRLAEAKGAAELILAAAYVKRSEVAVLAFRGDGAEVLLPPTRSLTRAKRALAALPGGGGTPLAQGLVLARQMAESVAARGATPVLVFLTDGSANIAADGSRGRVRAQDDALAAARGLASAGHDSVLIDISPRPRPEAARLAQALRARYLPLPCADAQALHAAVAGIAA